MAGSGRTTRTNAAIRALASRQYGAVSRAQLLRVGVTRREIQYRLGTGGLKPLHIGVYGVGPIAGELQREMAAVLACGGDAFLSHATAAACLELASRTAMPKPVAVSTTRDVRLKEPGIRVYRVASLPADEVTTVAGIPCTAAGRTLLDLAGSVESHSLERALAVALREGFIDVPTLRALLARYPRQRGRRRLIALLDSDAGPAFTRSEAERLFLELVRAVGLPAPQTNVLVEGYEVDFVWRRERLIVEIDGRAYHSGDPAFEADRERDGILLAAGYRTMRVTWRQLTRKDEREKLMRRLKRVLEAAGV